MHTGDYRFWTADHGKEHFNGGLGIAQVFLGSETGDAPRPVQVGSGAEGFTAATKDDGANIRVYSEMSKRFCQPLNEFFIERIMDLGPIECDVGNRVLDFYLKHSI